MKLIPSSVVIAKEGISLSYGIGHLATRNMIMVGFVKLETPPIN